MKCNCGTRSGSPISHLRLHAIVGWAAASLGHHPVDVLLGILDITGLAMDAVLGIDLQLQVAALLVGHILVDAGGTEALLGSLVQRQIVVHGYAVVLQRQMGGLVALVIRTCERHRREQVEGDLAIGLGVHNGWAGAGLLQGLVILGTVLQGPGLATAHEDGEAAEDQAAVQAQGIVERGVDVAHAVQVLPHKGVFDSVIYKVGYSICFHIYQILNSLLRIAGGFHAHRRLCVRIDGLKGTLRGQHAALHGIVGALDAGHVEEASAAAHQAAAGEGQFLRQALEAALVDGTGSIGNAGGALKDMTHLGMRLEALELLEGTQPGILVVQANHKAHSDGGRGFVQMVQEGAAIGEAIQGPANGVLHQAGSVKRG